LHACVTTQQLRLLQAPAAVGPAGVLHKAAHWMQQQKYSKQVVFSSPLCSTAAVLSE